MMFYVKKVRGGHENFAVEVKTLKGRRRFNYKFAINEKKNSKTKKKDLRFEPMTSSVIKLSFATGPRCLYKES